MSKIVVEKRIREIAKEHSLEISKPAIDVINDEVEKYVRDIIIRVHEFQGKRICAKDVTDLCTVFLKNRN